MLSICPQNFPRNVNLRNLFLKSYECFIPSLNNSEDFRGLPKSHEDFQGIPEVLPLSFERYWQTFQKLKFIWQVICKIKHDS